MSRVPRFGEGAARFFCDVAGMGWRPLRSLSGKCSNSPYPRLAADLGKGGIQRRLTLNAIEHLSAAILRLANPLRASLPSLASARISFDPGLSGFSRTKNTRDMMAKNVVYMVNQYAPINNPRLFISVVMWTIFRETLTPAAAQA